MGFEPTISAGERPKTYALDRAATGTGIVYGNIYIYWEEIKKLQPYSYILKETAMMNICRYQRKRKEQQRDEECCIMSS